MYLGNDAREGRCDVAFSNLSLGDIDTDILGFDPGRYRIQLRLLLIDGFFGRVIGFSQLIES